MELSYEMDKTDSISNMMLSTSVRNVLLKFRDNQPVTDSDYIILTRGADLLKSISNGYDLIDPLRQSDLSASSDDFDVFNDTADIFLRENSAIDPDSLTSYYNLLSNFHANNRLSNEFNDEMTNVIHLFEELSQRFFASATNDF
jgi:hypothetical protein